MSAAETIEEVATALGGWLVGSGHFPSYDPERREGLHLRRDGAGFMVVDVRRSKYGQDQWELTDIAVITEAEALLLVCLLALPPEREKCPGCDGSKAQHYGVDRERDGPVPWKSWEGWMPGHGPDWCKSRPCPTCKGPDEVCRGCGGRGRQWYSIRKPRYEEALWIPPGDDSTRSPIVEDLGERECPSCRGRGTRSGEPRGYIEAWPWARHFLGAILQPGGVDRWTEDHGELGTEDREEWYPPEPGELEDRDAITVFADRLQSTIDLEEALAVPVQDARNRATLGEGLALWLTRAPCRACRGRPIRITVHPSEVRAWEVTHYPLNWQHMRERRIEEGAWIEATRTTRGGFDVIACCQACRGSGLALGGHVPALEGVARRLVPPTVLQGEHG